MSPCLRCQWRWSWDLGPSPLYPHSAPHCEGPAWGPVEGQARTKVIDSLPGKSLVRGPWGFHICFWGAVKTPAPAGGPRVVCLTWPGPGPPAGNSVTPLGWVLRVHPRVSPKLAPLSWGRTSKRCLYHRLSLIGELLPLKLRTASTRQEEPLLEDFSGPAFPDVPPPQPCSSQPFPARPQAPGTPPFQARPVCSQAHQP